MEQNDNPVANLLWCVLVALRTAMEDQQISSETQKRKYIAEWMRGARRVPAFQGMTREFTTLRELLDTNKRIPIHDTLTSLWESAIAYEGCSLFRFRTAINLLREQGWSHALCPWPERVLPETIEKGQRRGNHVLQLTRMEETFTPTGSIAAPLAILVLLNNPDNERAEEAFHKYGFSVVRGGETPFALKSPHMRTRVIRTLYIGHPDLPESVWGARMDGSIRNVWTPSLQKPLMTMTKNGGSDARYS